MSLWTRAKMRILGIDIGTGIRRRATLVFAALLLLGITAFLLLNKAPANIDPASTIADRKLDTPTQAISTPKSVAQAATATVVPRTARPMPPTPFPYPTWRSA